MTSEEGLRAHALLAVELQLFEAQCTLPARHHDTAGGRCEHLPRRAQPARVRNQARAVHLEALSIERGKGAWPRVKPACPIVYGLRRLREVEHAIGLLDH